MPVVKCKPTSPGRRFVVKVVNTDLHKGEPFAPLTAPKSKSGGRNNKGRITRRHQGGGHKQKYRVIDFRRNKDAVEATVERLEYDPNRSANIALLLYADGERRYIIAPARVSAGDKVVSGENAPISHSAPMPSARTNEAMKDEESSTRRESTSTGANRPVSRASA